MQLEKSGVGAETFVQVILEDFCIFKTCLVNNQRLTWEIP